MFLQDGDLIDVVCGEDVRRLLVHHVSRIRKRYSTEKLMGHHEDGDRGDKSRGAVVTLIESKTENLHTVTSLARERERESESERERE